MAYCLHAEVERLTGPENFLLMLDDDKDGVEDAGLFDAVASDAAEQVDAYLAAQYAVPFSGSIPPFVRQCAKIFACEMLYSRRGVAKDANPWTRQADTLRTRLEKIANGKDKLQVDADAPGNGVEVQTEPSRLAQPGGTMMF